MTTTGQQPEALVFANDRPTSIGDDLYQWALDAEALIRAQHASIAELAAAPQAVEAAVPDAPIGQTGKYKSGDRIVCTNAVNAKFITEGREYVAGIMGRNPGGVFVVADDGEESEYRADRFIAAPAHPAEGVPATIRMLDDRAAFEASVQKEHYWEGIRENLFDRLPSGKYAVVGIERHWQTWMAALAGTQPAAPQAVQDAAPDGWRDQLEQALCDLQTSPYPATAVAVKRIEKLLAAAPAHPAEGVPAQSYVADFFREKGFYPSLAQAFAAGVAHAATQPAAQGMEKDAEADLPAIPPFPEKRPKPRLHDFEIIGHFRAAEIKHSCEELEDSVSWLKARDALCTSFMGCQKSCKPGHCCQLATQAKQGDQP